MDIAQAVKDYCAWHKVQNHSQKTIDWYTWNLGKFRAWLVDQGRSTAIEDITVTDARAYLQSEAERTTLNPGLPNERTGSLSDRTLHCYARVIRAFFIWLTEEEYLTKNPMRKLSPPKLEERQKEILSRADVEQLLGLCNQRTFLGARMYATIAVLYDCGLRRGELVNLNLDDVDQEHYQLRISSKGKSKRSRLVPFSPVTLHALRKYLKHRSRFADYHMDALFISANGVRIEANPLSQSIKRLGKKAGIPRAHSHLFRHSMAVTSVMNGANQFEIKRILGHKDLSTTDGYMDYAQQHLADQHRRFSPMAQVVATKKGRAKR